MARFFLRVCWLQDLFRSRKCQGPGRLPYLLVLCCWEPLDCMLGLAVHRNLRAKLADITVTLKLHQTAWAQQWQESPVQRVMADLPGLWGFFKVSSLFSWWFSLLGWLLLLFVTSRGTPPALSGGGTTMARKWNLNYRLWNMTRVLLLWWRALE